jgi:hypothetical protein
VFGAAWFTAHVITDHDPRVVAFRDLTVKDIHLPGATAAEQQDFIRLISGQLSATEVTFPLDQLTASLDTARREQIEATNLETAPPRIVFSPTPATLISVNGPPRLQSVAGRPGVSRVVNTPFILLFDDAGAHFYLKAGARWVTAAALSRSSKDWILVEQRHLRDFLSPDVKAEVEKVFEKMKELELRPHRKTKTKARRTSDYFLSGHLYATTDGHPEIANPMVGSLVSRTNQKGVQTYRYYTTTGWGQAGVMPSFRVRAEPLEHAILEQLQQIFLEPEKLGLEARIRKYIEEAHAQSSEVQKQLAAHEAKKKKLESQYLALSEDVGSIGRELFRKRVAELEDELSRVSKLIETCDTLPVLTPDDADAVVRDVSHHIKALGGNLRELAPDSLRLVMDVFVKTMRIDGATKEVEVELRVPEWLLEDHSSLGKGFRIAVPPVDRGDSNTNEKDGPDLGHIECEASGWSRGGPRCKTEEERQA